jgi:hypothetical protein
MSAFYNGAAAETNIQFPYLEVEGDRSGWRSPESSKGIVLYELDSTGFRPRERSHTNPAPIGRLPVLHSRKS